MKISHFNALLSTLAKLRSYNQLSGNFVLPLIFLICRNTQVTKTQRELSGRRLAMKTNGRKRGTTTTING